MPNIDPLLDNNRAFAASRLHEGVSVVPWHLVFLVTCLDLRTDPAGFLGLAPGDAMVVRNAGGRVTPTVIADLALIRQIVEVMGADGPLEVAVVHHTQCGTGFLADADFRRTLSKRTGTPAGVLAGQAVTDPEQTVRADVQLLRSSPGTAGRVVVSGHVLDLDTGLVRTVVDAAGPLMLCPTAGSGAGAAGRRGRWPGCRPQSATFLGAGVDESCDARTS